MAGVKNEAMLHGRNLARARNQGATYAKGGMIAMPQAPVAKPKKKAVGRALPLTPPAMGPGMKKGGKC